jgi:serine/threonine-protein kinase RsbW
MTRTVPSTARVQLQLPTDPRFFRIATGCVARLVELVAPADRRQALSHDAQLAVQELCANIATHAYDGRDDGRFDLDLSLAEDVLHAEFRDRGTLFDAGGVRPPDLEHGQEHGYGLFLIRTLVDDVQYASDHGENHWHLVKRLR